LIKGTEGYQNAAQLFIETSRTLDFHKVCEDFIAFLPKPPANVLDVGSGAGQNALALAAMGFNVTAVEPVQTFLEASQETDTTQAVKWLQGNLPHLNCLPLTLEKFDFVLIAAVWHHLDETERELAVLRLSRLIKKGGKCAISLRNGPAGLGSRVFATDAKKTIRQFETLGFQSLLSITNQNSILANKEDVKWARIVLLNTH
jgi:2-polyprenyl-3-methyl-5-hydroxy-6-metoxy-1,4-benzoquinol methylase